MENKQQQQLPSIKLINTHENHNENNKPKQAKNYLNEITKFNLKLHRQKEEQNKANTFFQKQVKNLTNNLNLVVKNNKDENADINRYSSRVDYPDYSDNSNNNKNINDNEGSLVENDFKKEVILSKVHFKEQATNSYSNNNSKNYNNNVIAHNNQVSSVQSVQSGNSNNEMVKHVPTFMNNNSNNNTLNRLSNNNSNTNEDITSKSNIKDLKNNANQFNNNHLNKSISTFNKTTSKSVAYKDLINKELNQDLENNNNTYKTINNVTNPMNTNKKIINKHVNLNENKNHYILREVAQDMNYVANTKNNRHIHNSIDLKFKNSPRIHEKDSDTGRNLFKILAEKKSDFLYFLKHNIDGNNFPQYINPTTKRKIKEKREAVEREGITYLMEMHKKKDVPVSFPVAFIHEKIYKNNSEKTRCERYSQKLLILKSFIEEDEYNDKLYVKEFLIKNCIYDRELFTMEKLSNFVNYLKYGNMEFDTSRNFHQIIKDISNFDVYTNTNYIASQLSKQMSFNKPKTSKNILSMSGNKSSNKSIMDIKNSLHIKNISSFSASVDKNNISRNGINTNSNNYPQNNSLVNNKTLVNTYSQDINYTKILEKIPYSQLTNKQRHYIQTRKEDEEKKYLMKKQTTSAQKFLEDRNKFDLNKPLDIIKNLERQFKDMKMLGLHNPPPRRDISRKNNKVVNNQNHISIDHMDKYSNNNSHQNNNISINISNNQNNLNKSITNYNQSVDVQVSFDNGVTNSNNFKSKNNNAINSNNASYDNINNSYGKITKKIVEKEFKDNVLFDDIDSIRKKNKLLEFIMLKKARNNYLLKIESDKYEETANGFNS